MATWEVLIVIGGVSGFAFLGVQAWLRRQGRKIPERIDTFYAGFGYGIALAFLVDIAVQKIF